MALLRLNIKDNTSGSPVSVAPPLPALAPSPSCPFVPDAGRTEDDRLHDTNTEEIRDHKPQDVVHVHFQLWHDYTGDI